MVSDYVELGHSKIVSTKDLGEDISMTFYFPIHVVYIFQLNYESRSSIWCKWKIFYWYFTQGRTYCPSTMCDRFRLHRIALTSDISKIYRAVELTISDKYFDHIVWCNDHSESLRAACDVSALCYAANMAVKRNTTDHTRHYPLAAYVVNELFYIDDCFTWADKLISHASWIQFQELFETFSLRKWNSSEFSKIWETQKSRPFPAQISST